MAQAYRGLCASCELKRKRSTTYARVVLNIPNNISECRAGLEKVRLSLLNQHCCFDYPLESNGTLFLPCYAETKDALSSSRSHTPVPSRTSSPQPPLANGNRLDMPGHLTIRVIEGRNLALPPNVVIPEAIESAVKLGHQRKPSNRESLQPRKCWWLPYVVLEYDNNAILIDAIGGQLSLPTWRSHAQL